MSRDELNLFLKAIGQPDREGSVDKALLHFRSKYKERRNKYPGDGELYNIFRRCLSKGLSVNESMLECMSIINREMVYLDIATANGIPYIENWF